MATHSRRRFRAPSHRGRCRPGAMACGVGDAPPFFIFSSAVADDEHSLKGLKISRVAERTRLFPEREYSGKY